MEHCYASEQRYHPVRSARQIGEERRRRIYDFIVTYADELEGPTPTINEVAANLALDYKVTYYHVMKLIAQGLLRQERSKLVVVGASWKKPEISSPLSDLRDDPGRQ
jgi:hypothetical protein